MLAPDQCLFSWCYPWRARMTWRIDIDNNKDNRIIMLLLLFDISGRPNVELNLWGLVHVLLLYTHAINNIELYTNPLIKPSDWSPLAEWNPIDLSKEHIVVHYSINVYYMHKQDWRHGHGHNDRRYSACNQALVMLVKLYHGPHVVVALQRIAPKFRLKLQPPKIKTIVKLVALLRPVWYAIEPTENHVEAVIMSCDCLWHVP